MTTRTGNRWDKTLLAERLAGNDAADGRNDQWLFFQLASKMRLHCTNSLPPQRKWSAGFWNPERGRETLLREFVARAPPPATVDSSQLVTNACACLQWPT